ncbi:hypothetical protein ACVXG7_23755 [Enterobacter hormaechei]
MERFTAADRAAKRTDTTGVDADTGTLGNVFTMALEVALMESKLSPHSIRTQD